MVRAAPKTWPSMQSPEDRRSAPNLVVAFQQNIGIEQARSDVVNIFVAAESTADFNCDTSDATKPEGMCPSRRKIYDSAAHERTTIIYPDDDGFAVADVCYTNLCSKRESPVCSSQGARSYPFAVRRLRTAAGCINGSDARLYSRGVVCE